MSSFRETDLGASRLSQKELNDIALNKGGVIGGIGYGYATRGQLPTESHGYGFRWINSQGMGNYGTLILVGVSSEAREFLRQGKVARMMRDLNLDYTAADALYSAACGVRRGMEKEVLAYAAQTADCRPAWAHFPGVGKGVGKWLAEWQMPTTKLSVPRLAAVAEIISHL